MRRLRGDGDGSSSGSSSRDLSKQRDILMVLRGAGRYILGSLALVMLWQVASLVLKVERTISHDRWSDSALFALVACYIGWIVVTALGGLCGLYSSVYLDIPTASWCLRRWWLLIVFQVVEGAVLFGVLCDTHCSIAIWQAGFEWNTLSLLSTEAFFLVYVYLYMHILQACAEVERQDDVSDDAYSSCFSSKQNHLDKKLSPIVYGSTSTSITTIQV
ncbi:hypothetical protein DYB36_007757 [Aphanomyces astaci]|uniref:Uncharacterized protein n=1 Tax=Aphanomyces astaci TaxID=112090 RepID=A0A397BBL3_APHAT|nr:hypothetical protein DYB36_007757 [Aphanomyces astaci]